MTADHGDSAAPGATPGRYPTHGEAEGRFDLVVRGYDRRQVDEHIANLERTIARQRSEMQQARSAPRDGGQVGNSSEKIGEFTGRLKSILEAAEEEAKEIRAEARNYVRGEEEATRSRLSDLERRRDAVIGDLSRVRGNLDGLLARFANQSTPKTPAEGDPLPPRNEKLPTSGRPDQAKSPQSTPRIEPTGRPDPGRGLSSPTRPSPSQSSASSRPSPSPIAASSRPSLSDLPSRSDGTPRPSPAPAKSPEQGSRVSSMPYSSAPKPSPRPTTEDSGKPGSSRPSPSTPDSSTPLSPTPRPSPSPRPRTTPTPGTGPSSLGLSGLGLSGLGPSATGPSGLGSAGRSAEPVRNGALNRENVIPPKRDEDGGHSAFGTGAR